MRAPEIMVSFTTRALQPPSMCRGASSTVPTAINASGEVVGYYDDSTGVHGFIDDKGTFITIDPPGG